MLMAQKSVAAGYRQLAVRVFLIPVHTASRLTSRHEGQAASSGDRRTRSSSTALQPSLKSLSEAIGSCIGTEDGDWKPEHSAFLFVKVALRRTQLGGVQIVIGLTGRDRPCLV